MIREKVSYYEKNWKEHDDWYDTHQANYRSEIKALEKKKILEIFENIVIEFKEIFQTLFHPPPDIKQIEEPRRGFGHRGFVVIKAKKI
jgi:hypothetical protein